jgi:hypothetical protein
MVITSLNKRQYVCQPQQNSVCGLDGARTTQTQQAVGYQKVDLEFQVRGSIHLDGMEWLGEKTQQAVGYQKVDLEFEIRGSIHLEGMEWLGEKGMEGCH